MFHVSYKSCSTYFLACYLSCLLFILLFIKDGNSQALELRGFSIRLIADLKFKLTRYYLQCH